MTGVDVDAFTERLRSEMGALSPENRAEVIRRVSADLRAIREGRENPVWRGPIPLPDVIGRELQFESDRGTRIARAVCFGMVPSGDAWERTIICHNPASGTLHEVPSSMARLAEPGRMENEALMAERLRSATVSLPPDRRPARRAGKTIPRDPALLGRLIGLAREHPDVSSVEEGPVCWKIVGRNGLRAYLFRHQMRCNLAGYNVAHKAVRCIGADEARSMHLGSVRGQIVFDDPAAAEEAFLLALGAMAEETKG